jgi:capsular exopolysaccharide synthesis family protein
MDSEPDNQQQAKSGTFAETDLHRYLRVLSERRWVLVGVLIAGAVLFVLWASRQVKIYKATATVIVEREPPRVFGQGEVRDVVSVGPAQSWFMEDYMKTQLRVLVSDALMRRVVERLELLSDAKFWGGAVPPSLQAAAEGLTGMVKAEVVIETQIISISVTHVDPAQAKRVADGVVDTYMESNLDLRDTGNLSASEWLAGEEDQLLKRLTGAELAVYNFKKENDLLSVSLEDRQNNTARQVDRVSDALTDVRLRKVARSVRVASLEKMAAANPMGLPLSESDPLSPFKTALIDEERKLAELKARYEDAHPLVHQQAAKVALASAQITREIQLQLDGARARTDEAADEEKRLAMQLEAAKQEGLRVTRLEVEYNKLKREADAISKQYLLVMNRTKEAELASKVKVNNLHVLDYARLPLGPISPRLGQSAMVALATSLVVALFLIFALDALDRSVKTQDDIETKLGLPFLGIIPTLDEGQSDRIVAEKPHSPPAECCRLIRTNLMFAGLERPLRRLLVTSPVAREGKTMTSISLAIVLAQAGQKILLVDCDLRRPRVAKALGIDGGMGFTNVLIGAAPLEQAIQPTGIPNLSVLCAGPIPPNPAELVEGQHCQKLLERCSEKFDRVIIDSPPAVPVTDPGIMARYCDGVIVVIRSRKTHFDQALRSARNLADVGARIVGVVLNDYPIWSRHYAGYLYGYGDPYASRRAIEPERKAS